MSSMLQEVKRRKSSSRRLMNTMQPPLSSVKSREFSPTIYKPMVKPSSSKVKWAQRHSFPLRPQPSSKNIYWPPPELPPRTSTENHMPRSSRSSLPSLPRPTNLPIKVQSPTSSLSLTNSLPESPTPSTLKEELKIRELIHTTSPEDSLPPLSTSTKLPSPTSKPNSLVLKTTSQLLKLHWRTPFKELPTNLKRELIVMKNVNKPLKPTLTPEATEHLIDKLFQTLSVS